MTDLSLSPGADPDVADDGVWLTCIECGTTTPPFDAVRYTCPSCDGLLEVRYDSYAGFDDFAGDGVWRYREVLPVGTGVTVGEGETPLVDVPELAATVDVADLRVKHEGLNPTGSFKDRGMTVGVAVADRVGVDRLACASTGNTSAALACYGARADYPTLVLLPAGKVAAGKVAQAALHGAEILEVDGDFDACLDLVRDLTESGEAYLLNSLNPFRLEGQKTIGLEILEQARAATGAWPDRIVLPVGNAGNTAALYKAFRELVAAGAMTREEMPALTGVQATGAAPFVEAVQAGADRVTPWTDVETRATAIRIGDPVNGPKALPGIRATGGTAVAITDDEIATAQRDLAAAGVGVEPASATGLAGLRELRAAGVVDSDERVVCLATGHALKDPDEAVAVGTTPTPVAADVDSVLAALE
ncbi:MAG: threonine synthase [Halobacteriaceae archaeon]